ncbi:hypothetical protein [Limnoglobus roseus]|nr:hypothetical protein [Limnoglobus roseus]
MRHSAIRNEDADHDGYRRFVLLHNKQHSLDPNGPVMLSQHKVRAVQPA